ncbi:MAG: Na/Pi cotransporter family protein [Ruminococcaceae bacterium]|nr:Na/Pi cotransporter family protein [Oscillospiraceae bacterium]
MSLISSLIWLLAGVGVFIVGMNFMGDALEKSAGSGMKKFLGKISNNRFSGLAVGTGVTAIIQSSSATSVMVIGLVSAGVMTLTQATPILLGAKIGTTVTGLLVALKNDIFNLIMYIFAFAGIMMGFSKKEKMKLLGSLIGGLGLIFVGLEIMGSEQAFRSPEVLTMFRKASEAVTAPGVGVIAPLLLVLIGIFFTALIQSSSAATGVIITMVGAGAVKLDLAIFLVIGANVGTCVTALLAAVGGKTNAKRTALIHLTFNAVGAVLFTAAMWIFKEEMVLFLTKIFPNDNDVMSLQMRVSLFHVIFNVTNALIMLPFVKQLVGFAELVIKDKKEEKKERSLKFVDEHMLAVPSVALVQVKKEMDYMLSLAHENTVLSFESLRSGSGVGGDKILENEAIIDYTNSSLTKFLIKLSTEVSGAKEETVIGSYFHVLNDLERIGDHAENFYEIGAEMEEKELTFSDAAVSELTELCATVEKMFEISKDAFENLSSERLAELTELEEKTDEMKRALNASHFARLAEGNCSVDHSPYFSSAVVGLERVADHLVNVGYSILNPTGSQKTDA